MLIFLLGADRSGTSFYARSLSMMGAYFGRYVGTESNPLNQKGQYENSLANDISGRLNEFIDTKKHTGGLINKLQWKYRSRGIDKWYKYHTFQDDPDWEFPKNKSHRDIDSTVAGLMKDLLKDLDSGGVGVIKQPGMVYNFPLWIGMAEELGIDYKIVAVFRNPRSFAKSRYNQASTLKMPTRSPEGYIKEWSIKNRLLLNHVNCAMERGIDTFWNNFDWPAVRMIENLKNVCAGIGLDFDNNKSKQLVDPRLKHYNNEDNRNGLTDEVAAGLYETLLFESESASSALRVNSSRACREYA